MYVKGSVDGDYCMFKIGKGKPVIVPHKILRERIPSSRVLPLFTPRLFRTAAGMLHERSKVRFSGLVFRSIVGYYNNRKVFIALPFWGAPAATAGLEVLIAGGGKLFIMAGEAGALSPKLRIGDVLVPTWGLREEGTSYHYMPPNVVPKPDTKIAGALYEEVRKIKGRRKIRVLRGGIWSTDAIFRETDDKVAEYSKLGILGVDMEATALMTVAKYRGVHLAIVTAVSDELYGDQRRTGFNTKKLRRTEKIVVEASLRTLTKYNSN